MKAWLRTDEYEEVGTTLRACRKFIEFAKTDITYWKWVFIALHNAVQGCMVIALTHSDGLGALNPKQERLWRKAHANSENLPPMREKLLSFLELYERTKQKESLPSSTKTRFVPRGTQGRSMKKLNQIRDEFIHFTPKGWALNLCGAPQVAIDCLEVAAFLVAHSGRFCIHASYQEGELINLIRDLQTDLEPLRQ